MKIYQTIIALTLLLSCQSNSNGKKDSNKKIDSGVTATLSVTKDTTRDFNGFEEFWKSFRQSVLNSDTTQMIALTQFPFETRGPLDSDPTIKHTKQKFAHVFEAFLNQWNGMDLEGTTEFESIMKTTTVNNKDISDDYTRVGDLVFKKTKDDWKLVFAYLNNETIEALNK